MSETLRAPIYVTDDNMINKVALPIVRVFREETAALRTEIARLTIERDQARGDNPFWDMARNAIADNDALRAEVARLVSDLRNLDELFRNATDQSNRATQALVNERAEVARLRDLIDRSNLEETDGYEAQGPRLVKNGRILVPKDLVAQEARITEALQTAAKHAREVARLREALQSVRELADNDTGDFRADLAHCVGVAEAALANETAT